MNRITRNRLVTKAGFTLVETLVAISILLVVIVGPMTIASKGMQSAYFAGDQTTAIYLAQEAIEYIQRLRDNEALANFEDYRSQGNDGDGNTAAWYTSNTGNFSSYCVTSNNAAGCDIEFETSSFRNCTTMSNCQLGMYTGSDTTSQTRVYGYAWTTDSPFTRVIRVGSAQGGTGSSIGGVPVTVTVSWNAATLFGVGSVKSVTLQTYIYDHYTRYE